MDDRIVQAKPIEVKPEDRRIWQRRLIAALQEPIWVTDQQVFPVANRIAHYLFTLTTDVREVLVRVDIPADIGGRIMTTVECECEEAGHGIPCEHAALALDAAGLWPRGMIVTATPGTEEGDERWEYRVTEWAAIIGTERRGVVSGIRADAGRPVYRLDDPHAHEPLGWFFSYELTPSFSPLVVPDVDRAIGLAILMGGGR